MAVRFTESATFGILEIMKTGNLSPTEYAFELFIENGQFIVQFSNELHGTRKVNDLIVKVARQIEQGENLVVDYVTNPEGKQGLIFIEEKYYGTNSK